MKMIEDRKAMAGQGGFTLIELLVVIAILAVLAGAAVIGIGAMRGNAEEQVCKTDAKTIETAGEAYLLDDGATAPLSQGALVAEGYLKESVDNFTITEVAGAASVVGSGPCAP